MEKENQRVILTKRLLKEGMLHLLETKELDKINITELCKEAGINRITFYRHYETPRDVLLDVERELLNELKLSLKMPETMQEIKQYMEEACTFLESNLDLLKIIIQNNSDSDFYFLFNDLFLEVHKKSPIFGNISQDALEILSVCGAGSSYFLMRQWLLGNIKKSPKEIATIFYNQLCNTDWVTIGKQLGLM